jgi:dodecin
MPVVKVIEVIAQSDKSWEDAAHKAVREAGRSVRGIKSIWIKDMQAKVENGKITQYRINAKLSFTVEGTEKS